jgi:NAD(P)-dependent dehydrogenase (short-subunit alcohol dehydrogenase family)
MARVAHWSQAAAAVSAPQFRTRIEGRRLQRRGQLTPAMTEKAEAFKAETGIHVYKWDVADYDACAAGIAQVESDLGPVEVLVNNAGITRDGMFHKMDFDQWRAVMSTNLDSACSP